MEIIDKLKSFFVDKKNMSNIFIILIIGVIILIFGSNLMGGEEKQKPQVPIENTAVKAEGYEQMIERKLTDILSQIEGVGKTSVMITFSKGKEVAVVYDAKNTGTTTNEKDNNGGERVTVEQSSEKTLVMGQAGSGNQAPVILSENNPIAVGVLVVAEGASDALVKKNIIDAVKAVMDVPAHRIEVFSKK